MREIKIITDSGSDLSYVMVSSLNIGYLGLECDMEGVKIIEDGRYTIDYKDFYEKLLKGVMPKTSQLNPTIFFREFEKNIKNGYDILYIALSSGLSGTYNNALTASKELLEEYSDCQIRVIDSKAASGGQGLLVYTAAMLKAEGKCIDEISEYLEVSKKQLYHFFTVKDLKHLVRGGRISAATAMVGNMLNINPILTFSEKGTLEQICKTRGQKKAIKELINNIGKNVSGIDLDTVFISHADNDKAVEQLVTLIKENWKVKKIIINYMSIAIGSHTGQGAVGVYFLGKKRK